MAKYYTLCGGALYVYTTRGEPLLDLGVIPSGIGLFDPDVSWRLCPWLAVTEDAPTDGLRLAEIILRAEGYGRLELEGEALEDYFLRGDDGFLAARVAAEAEEAVPIHQWTLDGRPSARTKPAPRRQSRRSRVPKPAPLPRASDS